MTQQLKLTLSERPDSGLSLVEVLLVLGIISAAYVLAMPGFVRSSGNFGLRAFAHDLTGNLRVSRAAAIGSGSAVGISFDVKNRIYVTDYDKRRVKLPEDLTLTLTTARDVVRSGAEGRIVFFADGSSSGGKIVLQRNQEQLVISVEWLTGFAQIEAVE